MTTPDETLHFSDDEREVFRLRAKLSDAEADRDNSRAITKEALRMSSDAEIELDNLRRKVAALEHCVALSNESALQSAGRIRELEKALLAYGQHLPDCSRGLPSAGRPCNCGVLDMRGPLSDGEVSKRGAFPKFGPFPNPMIAPDVAIAAAIRARGK